MPASSSSQSTVRGDRTPNLKTSNAMPPTGVARQVQEVDKLMDHTTECWKRIRTLVRGLEDGDQENWEHIKMELAESRMLLGHVLHTVESYEELDAEITRRKALDPEVSHYMEGFKDLTRENANLRDFIRSHGIEPPAPSRIWEYRSAHAQPAEGARLPPHIVSKRLPDEDTGHASPSKRQCLNSQRNGFCTPEPRKTSPQRTPTERKPSTHRRPVARARANKSPPADRPAASTQRKPLWGGLRLTPGMRLDIEEAWGVDDSSPEPEPEPEPSSEPEPSPEPSHHQPQASTESEQVPFRTPRFPDHQVSRNFRNAMVPSQMPPLRQPAPLNQPSLLPSRTGIHQPHPQSHAPHVPSETIINGGNQAFKNAGPYAPGGGQAVVDTSQLDPDVHQQNGFQFKPAPSRYAFLRQDPPRVPPLHFNANGAIPYPHLHHPSPSLNRPPTRNPQLFHAQSGSTHGPVPMDASSGAGLLPRQEGGTRGTFWQEDPDARRAVAFWKAKKTIDRLVGRPTFADNTPVTRPTGVNNTTVARPSRAYNTPVARPPVHLKCRTPFGGCNPPFVGCSKNYRVTVDLTSDPEEDVKITVGAKGSTGVKRENIFGYEDVCAKRQRVPLQPTTTNNKFYRETVDLTSDADEDVKTMVGAKSSTGASGRGSITHQAFMSVRR